MKIITIQNNSTLPKYKQIVLSIEIAIAEKRLNKNDKLPSVNKVSLEFSISRDTVLLAYLCYFGQRILCKKYWI